MRDGQISWAGNRTLDVQRSLLGPDGGLLAYRVEGRGPALLLTNGITTSNFFWSYLHRRWVDRHTLINWDLKGHGRSAPARSPEAASISALADDLLRVLDASGQRRATLVGFSMGCQVSLEAYRRAPERVAALVLLLGPAGRVFDNALGPIGKLLHLGIEHMSPRVFNFSLRSMQRVVASPIAYRLGRGLRLLGPAASRADVQRFIDRHTTVGVERTVARAYAELERDGWVVTQGRRGTSVAPGRPKRFDDDVAAAARALARAVRASRLDVGDAHRAVDVAFARLERGT